LRGDLIGLAHDERLEDIEAGQPVACALQIIGIVFLAQWEAGLPAHKGRVHPFGAGDGYLAIACPLAGGDGERRIDGSVAMVGGYLPIGDLGLGKSLLAPGLRRQPLGTQDGRRPGDLAWREPLFLR
jgi:hypothetical protein